VQTQGFRGASSRDDGGGPDASHNRWVPIQIIDVSNAGLAALSAVVPPRGERIWFRLEDDPGVEWVEISVVGSSPSGSQHLVRFAFRDNCPYDLFKALVLNGGPVRS
jgi:hypothetical protein